MTRKAKQCRLIRVAKLLGLQPTSPCSDNAPNYVRLLNNGSSALRTLTQLIVVVAVYFFVCCVFGYSTYAATPAPPIASATDQASHQASDDKAVTDSKRALSRSVTFSAKFPWYSPQDDDSAFVPFPPEREEPKPETLGDMPKVSGEGLFWGIGFGATVIIAIAVLLLIVVIAWYIVHYHGNMLRKIWRKEELKERQRRLETLPEEARDMFDDLVGAARRAFESGDYRKALIYYFSHQLVWLDTHELIRMHKGKTNHEYDRELTGNNGVKPYYERAMALFESVYYGEHHITRPIFLTIWEERDHFKTAVIAEKQRRDQLDEKRSASNGTTSVGGLKLSVELPDHLQGVGNGQQHDHSNGNTFGNTLLLLVAALVVTLGTGCRPEVETHYTPPNMTDRSINGSSVFCDLCTNSGHSLRDGYYVNSYAKNADVILWFAQSHSVGPKSLQTIASIEEWLKEKPGRTFVYIGRAFESDRDYWASVEGKTQNRSDQQRIKNNKFYAESELQRFLAQPEITKQSGSRSEGDVRKKKKTDLRTDNQASDQISNNTSKQTGDQTGKQNDLRVGDDLVGDGFEDNDLSGGDHDSNHDDDNDGDFNSGYDGNDVGDNVTGDALTDDFEKALQKVADLLDLDFSQKYTNDWYTSEPLKKEYVVKQIDGTSYWTTGIDQSKLQLSCFEKWSPKTGFVTELSAERNILLSRKKVGESQIFLIANAGFLLNHPLINHEHRKLAGRLVKQFGESKKRLFVYRGDRDFSFDQKEPASNAPPHLLFTLLQIWPVSVVIWQVILVGVVFCFYKWPMLGRPKRLPDVQVTNFGMHIDAYTELLIKAKGGQFAQQELESARSLFVSTEKSDGHT